jgi:UDP-sugar transporter A1/2/3|tara:strand:+ start:364 stop:1593 length:1230 start_codon:yes stop_codon:yes gene_type:complete
MGRRSEIAHVDREFDADVRSAIDAELGGDDSEDDEMEMVMEESDEGAEENESSGAPEPETHLYGIPMWIVQVMILSLLVVQNVVMYLVARYSQAGGKAAKPYLKTTVVLMTECLKLCVCFIIVTVESGFGGMLRTVKEEIFGKFLETLKVGVPALLYFFQNTLFYVGSANLDAAPFQAVNQFKVVTTAIVTVIFFRRCIKPLQWVSIVSLMGGLMLVVLSNLKSGAPKKDTNPLLGYGATLGICALSGCAGVYFEHVLKGSKVSIWVRNIQLSMMSIFVAVITVASKDGKKIMADGFFQGYTPWTVACICIIALGGLTIAMVLKYASAILKTFATGAAIVVTGVISSLVPAFNFMPNLKFCAGTALVVGSIFLYGYAGAKKKAPASSSSAPVPPTSDGYGRVKKEVEMK